MRIEEYIRSLGKYGYRVVGSNRPLTSSYGNNKDTPIEMRLTCSSTGSPIGVSLGELADLADSDCFLDDDAARQMHPEFREHYKEIMMGTCPDWQLGAFRVFYGGIQLNYGNRRTGETGFLWIIGARLLRLTFVTPQTRLGFAPTYKVSIDCYGDGISETDVEEDLGYICRDIHFELCDPHKKTDIFHSDNQLLRVTEYAGM